MDTSPIVIVPGVGNSDPQHWQSWVESRAERAVRVVQDDWNMPVRDDWTAALEQAVAAALDLPSANAPVLVGHSAGSVTIVHWAAASPHASRIAGALLVAPADLEVDLPDGTPVEFLDDAGWVPCPRSRLPFASIVVASTDDPYASLERSRALALAWGSRLVTVESGGHLNTQAGLGPWPQAERWIEELRGGKS